MGVQQESGSGLSGVTGDAVRQASAAGPCAIAQSVDVPRPQRAYAFGDFTLDLNRGALLRHGRDVRLRPKSFKVLSHLIERHGRLVPKEELLAAVWDQAFVTDGSLTQCVIEIRRALGSQTRTALRTIPRRGFIFDAPVTALAGWNGPAPVDLERRRERMAGPTRSTRAWTVVLTSTIVATIVMVAAVVLFNQGRRAGVGAGRRPAVALMPFANPAGSNELAWLSDGLPGLLLTALAETPGLDVIGRDRLSRSAQRVGSPASGAGGAAETARRAGAGAIVTGEFYESQEKIRIDVRVEDLRSGRVLAADKQIGTDVFALVDALAAAVKHGLDLADRPAPAGVETITTDSLEAYRYYSEGRTALDHSRWDDARDLLQRAIALDPDFAAAYYYLTFTRERLGETGANGAYEQKVLALVNRLPGRLRMLVEANHLARTGDVRAAIGRFDALIARYPDQEDAYTLLQNLYHGIAEPQRALQVAQRAVAALPLEPGPRNMLGYALLSLARYDEAVAEFDRYAEFSPREPNPHDSAGEAYLAMGEPEKAAERFRLALAIDPSFVNSRQSLSWTLGMLGRYDAALDEIRLVQPALAARHLPGSRAVLQEAFLLSRVGRYREARECLAALAAQGDQLRSSVLVSLHLLSALLWLEQGDIEAAEADLAAAETRISDVAADEQTWIARDGRLVTDFMAGMAAARGGRLDAARERLANIERDYRRDEPAQNWWYHTLAGEIALAAGGLVDAEAAFRAGEPQRPIDYGWGFERGPFLHAFRDGLARTLERRGDLPGAVAAYRRLLTPGHGSHWQTVLAPRVILALGQALGRCGDVDGSNAEVRRFLTLWQDADPTLLEFTQEQHAPIDSGNASVPCSG